LVVITLQYNAHNVFADVVHVTLHRRQQNFSVTATGLFFGVNKRL
ncbi:hypothetical protein D043_4494, partial [Vibrio parahaemolyticus EKP-021]